MDASVVVLTWNGERYLDEVLRALAAQTVRPREVLAIDSGSRDRTRAILDAHGARVHAIDRAEFSHSRTRNLGARLAQGSHVVFLTQDATPRDALWLERLLRALAEYPRAAGAYSRQVPRAGANPLEAADLARTFGPVRRVQAHPGDAAELRRHLWELIRFSDVSAAYPRALLLERPFDEALAMGEDQEWAHRALGAGLEIVYEPASVVLHSHEHGLREKWERNRAMGAAFGHFLRPVLGPFPFPWPAWLFAVAADAGYLLREPRPRLDKLLWMARSPVHRAVMHLAYWRGWNASA